MDSRVAGRPRFCVRHENCFQTGDHVRVHVLDAAEAPVFLQEWVYLTGVVVSPLAAHDSSLVSVVGLAGEELFLVPNTRMEHVTAAESSRVVDILKVARNKVRTYMSAVWIAIRNLYGSRERSLFRHAYDHQSMNCDSSW